MLVYSCTDMVNNYDVKELNHQSNKFEMVDIEDIDPNVVDKDSSDTVHTNCYTCIDPCLVDPYTLECTDYVPNPGNPLPPSAPTFNTSLSDFPATNDYFFARAKTTSNVDLDWMQIDLQVKVLSTSLVNESEYDDNVSSLTITEPVIKFRYPTFYDLNSQHTGRYEDMNVDYEENNNRTVYY